jgi:hypothetical protein
VITYVICPSNKLYTNLHINFTYDSTTYTALTTLPIDFSEEKIRDYYQEYKSGNGYYLTDTDDDGLENFREIAFDSKLIRFAPDLVLPTFGDCYDLLEETGRYTSIKEGYEKFIIARPFDQIRAIRVLPINSDPIKKDGDNDGIKDKNELIELRNTNIQTVDYTQALVDSREVIFEYSQNYKMDFSWFYSYMENPQISFNRELSLASTIFAGLAYHTTIDSDLKVSDRVSDEVNEYYYAMNLNNLKQSELPEIMKEYGFENVETINLREKYADNDLIQFDIGTHDMTEYTPEDYADKKTNLLSVFVRGTHGTEEWMSNFDIGNTDDWYPNNDWKTRANHKGFDVAATRSLKEIHDYMNENSINKDNTIIWLTGHSRGGSVAGILATYLIDEGFTVYDYNFAPPNQVETGSVYINTKSPESYNGIFNIVNADDLVPELPLTAWGFTKYGEIRPAMSLNPGDEDKWSDRNIKSIDDNNSKYKTSPLFLAETINAFEKVSSTRNGCYEYEKINSKKISFSDNDNLFRL